MKNLLEITDAFVKLDFIFEPIQQKATHVATQIQLFTYTDQGEPGSVALGWIAKGSYRVDTENRIQSL